LVSKAYAEERAKSIGFMQATPSKNIRQGQPARHESANTTHFSIVDVAGNVVANTYTLRNFYGSGVTVGGAGFLLNNVMDDYATKPGEANSFGYVAGQVNEVGALGAQGGPTITNSVLQVLTNMIDHGMDLQEAVDAPRIHHQWLPDILRYEPGGLAIDVIAALEKRGHKLGLLPKGAPGSVNAVSVNGVSSLRLGAADPRNPDGAARGC
jgi:gamma-glutamyltranspeptidase/glutathione hydrolase